MQLEGTYGTQPGGPPHHDLEEGHAVPDELHAQRRGAHYEGGPRPCTARPSPRTPCAGQRTVSPGRHEAGPSAHCYGNQSKSSKVSKSLNPAGSPGTVGAEPDRPALRPPRASYGSRVWYARRRARPRLPASDPARAPGQQGGAFAALGAPACCISPMCPAWGCAAVRVVEHAGGVCRPQAKVGALCCLL